MSEPEPGWSESFAGIVLIAWLVIVGVTVASLIL